MYNPPRTSDTNLHAAVNPDNNKFFGLSHISFCYLEVASPTLVTNAQTPVTVGNTITDTATLSGGNNPTGTITFKLFAPGDTNCTGNAVFTSVKNVNGNGNYTSDPLTTTATGTYRWTAEYSGDANNNKATSPCNATNEQSVANQATLTGITGVGTPTGTVTFELFKDLTCGANGGASVYKQENVALVGGTASTSNSGDPSVNNGFSINAGNFGTGNFSWKVTYNGDTNYASTTSCKEESTVTIDDDDTV